MIPLKALQGHCAIVTLIAALSILPGAAAAQSAYPDKPIRLLVGLPPGGAPDITARVLAEKLSEAWGKPVVVENVPGAGGNIAADRVAKAAPDGYTLYLSGNAAIVVNVSLYERMPYDPVKDLTPIAQVSFTPNVLAVPNDVPVKTVQELVALAKSQPGQLTFAHGGIGISQHLAGELFKSMAHLDIRPVSYRGAPAIMPDLLGGRVTMCFCNVVNVMPLVREGKLRALAVTSPKRSPAAPDLPTMSESGFPGFDATAWFGLMAPAGTPPAIIDKLQRETVRILALPDVRKKFSELGMEAIGNSSPEFAAVIKAEIAYWAKVIKDAGIKAQ